MAPSSLWGTEKAEVRRTPAVVGIRWLGANVAVSNQFIAILAVVLCIFIAMFAPKALFIASTAEALTAAFGTHFLFLHFFPPVV